MKFKKMVISLLALVTLLSIPTIVTNAKALPNKNSNYWSQSRSIKTTKKITIYEHKVANNTIQNKVIKKKVLNKGTALTVARVNNNHKEWILYGIKTAKNSIWVTLQNKTNWMKSYVQPQAQLKEVTTTKEIKINAYKVKNNVVQNKIIQSTTIPAGTSLLVKQFGQKQWSIFGNNIPKSKGYWLYNNSKDDWMNVTNTFKSVYKTVASKIDSNDISSSEYVDAYLSVQDPSLNVTLNGTTIYGNQKVRVQKTGDSSESILVNGIAYNVNMGNKDNLSTIANAVIVPHSDNSNVTNTRIAAIYAPDDSRNIMLKGYTPHNGDNWFQIKPDRLSYYIYVYSSSAKGWVFSNIYTPSNSSNSSK